MISIIFGVLIVKVMYSIEIANRNARASERLEDITKAGYDECTLYGNDLFVSEGKCICTSMMQMVRCIFFI